MGNARETALRALYACHREGGWSEVALHRELERDELEPRDAALASRLCYGVLQRQILLDFYIGSFCKTGLERLEKKVLEALRLGVYQLLWMDRIPAMAAVNESVNLVKKFSKNSKAAGMTNAILRNIDRNRDRLPEPEGDWLERVSIQYSHPTELVKVFTSTLGQEETEALLAANDQDAPITVQVNTLRSTAGDVTNALRTAGASVTPHPWLSDCLILEKTGDLTALEPFRHGDFYVQDPAARLAVIAARPAPGERVLDLCAAPGGKSFAAAIALGNRGSVLSRDIFPRKVELLRQGAMRLGLSCIDAQTSDATQPVSGKYDLVIADVPCSGLGIIRKKPEIRYKDPALFDELLPLQEKILKNASDAVLPGGRLLYATCTLRPQENEEQVLTFLSQNKSFSLLPLELSAPFGRIEAGMLTLWPHRHGTDGFFFALLGRREVEV